MCTHTHVVHARHVAWSQTQGYHGRPMLGGLTQRCRCVARGRAPNDPDSASGLSEPAPRKARQAEERQPHPVRPPQAAPMSSCPTICFSPPSATWDIHTRRTLGSADGELVATKAVVRKRWRHFSGTCPFPKRPTDSCSFSAFTPTGPLNNSLCFGSSSADCYCQHGFEVLRM